MERLFPVPWKTAIARRTVRYRMVLAIGDLAATANYLAAYIDDVRNYNRVVTATQIAAQSLANCQTATQI
jgi:hypothetical protein